MNKTWLIELKKPRQFSVLWDATQPARFGHPLKYALERTKTGFRMRDLEALAVSEFTLEAALAGVSVFGIQFSVRPARQWDAAPMEVPRLLRAEARTDDQALFFKRSASASSLLLAGLLALSFSISKKDAESQPLIPPQFAKIVLKPNIKLNQGMKQTIADSRSAKSVGVAQAFQSQQVQKSTRHLLKGAMSKLLLRSNLLIPSQAKVSQLFSAVNQDRAPASLARNTEVAPLQVSVAGGGRPGQGGVGYGKGAKLGIETQGNGFVALDTSHSAVEEGLSKDEVGRIIHGHMAEIRYCYENAILRNPNVQGKLMVDFTIGAIGRVSTASIKDSSLTDRSLDQCLMSRLKQWQFPKPKGGVTVAVTYPFIFKTLGQ